MKRKIEKVAFFIYDNRKYLYWFLLFLLNCFLSVFSFACVYGLTESQPNNKFAEIVIYGGYYLAYLYHGIIMIISIFFDKHEFDFDGFGLLIYYSILNIILITFLQINIFQFLKRKFSKETTKPQKV